jgi:hypothetical protein
MIKKDNRAVAFLISFRGCSFKTFLDISTGQRVFVCSVYILDTLQIILYELYCIIRFSLREFCIGFGVALSSYQMKREGPAADERCSSMHKFFRILNKIKLLEKFKCVTNNKQNCRFKKDGHNTLTE